MSAPHDDETARFPSLPPPRLERAEEPPRGDVADLVEQRRSAKTAIEMLDTPGEKEAASALLTLGTLRDLSWRQQEAFPGLVAKRAIQGTVLGVVGYTIFRIVKSFFGGK